VLAPTRELVIQIKETFDSLSTRLGVHTAVLVGGLSMRPQVTALERGPLVVVATPGRLLDHIRQRTINLDRVAYFVLDEADRMLDMGFQDQIDAILRKLPKQRQTLLFSATMDNAMTGLVRTSVREPVLVDVSDEVTEVPQVEHKFLEIVEPSKRRALRELLAQEPGTVLVFVNMKSRATMLSRYLGKEGFQATEIHGDLDQKARMRSLEAFRSGDARILVATDVAARGIDIEAIAHVVNFDMPLAAEDFVHRIGRTARAGATGRATSFVTVGDREMAKRVLRMLHERAPAPEVPAAGPPAPQFGRKARKVQSRKGPSRGVRLF
jgi:ATP-dependent RNA helicase RhlE